MTNAKARLAEIERLQRNHQGGGEYAKYLECRAEQLKQMVTE